MHHLKEYLAILPFAAGIAGVLFGLMMVIFCQQLRDPELRFRAFLRGLLLIAVSFAVPVLYAHFFVPGLR